MTYYIKLWSCFLMCVIVIIGWNIIFNETFSMKCYAISGITDKVLPDNVVNVKNKEAMKRLLIMTLKAHKKSISISYSGIDRDFRKYRKNNYIDLWNELQYKNGYYTGIVSGYYISYSEPLYSNMKYAVFQFNYITTKRQERYIDKCVGKIAKKYKGKSRIDKVKGVHDHLIAKVTYDNRYYSPYYIFKKGRGLCMAYSLAFQRIMQELNVPCIYVKGREHAWNMVKIGHFWYNIDVTWDDSTGSDRYFLKGYRDFHKQPLAKTTYIRSLNRAKYSYY